MTKTDALAEALRQHAPWMGGEAERLMLEAAAELRRLHAEVEALKQENQDLKDDLRESDYAQQMGDNHE